MNHLNRKYSAMTIPEKVISSEDVELEPMVEDTCLDVRTCVRTWEKVYV